MPTLTLKVSTEFKTRLTRAARKRKVSVSELVRAAVEKELRIIETTRRGATSVVWRKFFKSNTPTVQTDSETGVAAQLPQRQAGG